MPNTYAPIVFFAFNRPEHTARTLAALAANTEAIDSVLHIFVDGARNDEEQVAVAEVLRIANATTGFCSVVVHASAVNRGLYLSITRGVTQVVAEAKRVIVVEDDILVSPCFLKYMNDGLERYADDQRIGSIHGYAPPIGGLPKFFFLRGGDCWGWATWEDRWALFDPDARHLLLALVGRGELRTFSSTYGIQSLRHLIRRSRGRNQSWSAHWNASLFLESRLTLHTGTSFVQNIGNDGSGTHSVVSGQYATNLQQDFGSLPSLVVRQDTRAARMLRDFYDAVITFPLIGHFVRSIYLALLQARVRVFSTVQGSSHIRHAKGRPVSRRGGVRHD